jgi:L-lactate dehydrogenase
VDGQTPIKISIVGAGYVGASAAFALVQSGLVRELVLIDPRRETLEGEVLDLSHAASLGSPITITAGETADSAGSRIVIFTAGAKQVAGETRLALAERNTAILRQTLPGLVRYCPEAILLIVTNPVDILTYIAWKLTGLPQERVIGSGTVLDSARFRYLLATYLHIDPRNIHAHIIGEHGDSEVPVWSTAHVGGSRIDDFIKPGSGDAAELEGFKQEIGRRVISAAYEIIQRKGATAYGIALALKRICSAILKDENSVLTVSGVVRQMYGIDEEVCLSLPSLVNGSGRDHVLSTPLSAGEEQALQESARALRQVLRHLGF